MPIRAGRPDRRILAAARELFAERGYAATSLADIAAAVGLTKTAVAYHFHPKDRLAAELIAPAGDDMLALLGTDFRGTAAFSRALVEFAVRHRTVIRLLMEDIGAMDCAPPGSHRRTAPRVPRRTLRRIAATPRRRGPRARLGRARRDPVAVLRRWTCPRRRYGPPSSAPPSRPTRPDGPATGRRATPRRSAQPPAWAMCTPAGSRSGPFRPCAAPDVR